MRVRHMDEVEVPDSCQSGFSLAEFLIAALVLLIAASSIFGLISEMQRKALSQAEIQSVLDNTRIAMQTVGRYLRQAGNDPRAIGTAGITIISPSEIRIQSDLTGSAAPGNPDKGDPDGDTLDSGENVTIRYNNASRSLEIVPGGGSAQMVANYISGISFRCYDSGGAPVTTGSDVKKVNVTISGTSSMPDPETNRFFGVQLSSDFQTATL